MLVTMFREIWHFPSHTCSHVFQQFSHLLHEQRENEPQALIFLSFNLRAPSFTPPCF